MSEQRTGPRPCPHALGALGVPARRWLTRVDLYQQLQRAKAYLDEAPIAEATISGAAAAAGLSLHHFVRLFHELFHQTPHQYLTSRRVKEAQKLLTQTEWKAAQIALEIGFENASAFGRLFKSHVGQTPMMWRKSQNVPA